MAYRDDLLVQALDLVHKDPASHTQADLRRSVSAAYYGLFHLLISETIVHWRLDSSRDGLDKMFEHRVMSKASDRVLDSKLFPFDGEDPAVVQKLRKIAQDYLVSLLIKPRGGPSSTVNEPDSPVSSSIAPPPQNPPATHHPANASASLPTAQSTTPTPHQPAPRS